MTVVVECEVDEPAQSPVNPLEIMEVRLFRDDELPAELAFGMQDMIAAVDGPPAIPCSSSPFRSWSAPRSYESGGTPWNSSNASVSTSSGGLVGEGGMGKVYEAEERLSKRRVALKVLRAELTRTEEGRRLFLNEMQILAQLEHPNVVRSLATCEVDGQLVMALEFLDGRTLRQELVDRGRLPWPEAVRIAMAIAEGLAAAHAQQPAIVHRDLKPENVMLSDGGTVKVTDFGVAKVLAAAHATNTQSVGTLAVHEPGADRRPGNRRAQRSVRARAGALRVSLRRGAVPLVVSAGAAQPAVHAGRSRAPRGGAFDVAGGRGAGALPDAREERPTRVPPAPRR